MDTLITRQTEVFIRAGEHGSELAPGCTGGSYASGLFGELGASKNAAAGARDFMYSRCAGRRVMRA